MTGGVAADGVLQALPILWKEGGRRFFREIHSFALHLHLAESPLLHNPLSKFQQRLVTKLYFEF